MIPKLDSSHRCVLEHWTSIEQMKNCLGEVETYLCEMARKAAADFAQRHAADFTLHDSLKRDEYFELVPKKLAAIHKGKSDLLTFGVEFVRVRNLFSDLAEEPCAAFVYSPEAAGAKDGKNYAQQVAAVVQEPRGFEMSINLPSVGYVIRKELPPISRDDFMNSQRLIAHFQQPLEELTGWWKRFERAILKVQWP